MKIALIGLGNMGLPMAANLLKAGHSVAGFDLAPANLTAHAANGGRAAMSVADAVAGAAVVVTMLPAGKHVAAVYADILASVGSARPLLVDSSTIDVATARDVAAKAAAAGMEMLDAPVSGGVGGAVAGTLTFMCGGTEAGFAAAQAYGEIAAKVPGAAANAADQSVAAFTLMKVVGRDIWIGIWAIALSVIATTYWSQDGISNRPQAREVWTRFPKFVIGFLLASAFITFIAYHVGHADFSKVTTPALVAPIKNLRIWAFTFGFLSIGLTTRVRDLAGVGLKPVLAFSVGVVVNVVLGLILSVLVFGSYWENLNP